MRSPSPGRGSIGSRPPGTEIHSKGPTRTSSGAKISSFHILLMKERSQAFEEGDKNAPVFARVAQVRKRKVDRARKARKENHVREVMEDHTNTNSAKKGKANKTNKKDDQLIVKLKMKKEKAEKEKKDF